MMLFLVSDYNSKQELLLDAKQLLLLINDGGKRYLLKDLESDWQGGVTRMMNHYRVRRMV